MGGGFGDISGFAGTFEINYQPKNKSLFTFCYGGVINLGGSINSLSVITGFTNLNESRTIEEFAGLYGLRYIKYKCSYSFSAGISTNKYTVFYSDSLNNNYGVITHFIGFPYEVNIKWFNPTKPNCRASIGFKIFGNISKQTVTGIALVFGLGYYK